MLLITKKKRLISDLLHYELVLYKCRVRYFQFYFYDDFFIIISTTFGI
jgi:hypothetical protein